MIMSMQMTMWLLLTYLVVVCSAPEEILKQKLMAKIQDYKKYNIPINERSLIMYHVGMPSKEDSVDVLANNIRMFAEAMATHTEQTRNHGFYIFRVAGGTENSLTQYLRFGFPRASILMCSHTQSDIDIHIQTLTMLGKDFVHAFGSVLFFSGRARGPFYERNNGEWISSYENILTKNPNVGIVGSTINCQIQPHVQSHAFAMRSDVAWDVMTSLHPERGKKRKNHQHMEIALSVETQNAGYKMASLLYKYRTGNAVFNGQCVEGRGQGVQTKSNPTSWCDLKPREVMFMKWGGLPLRVRGFFCHETMQRILNSTYNLGTKEPSMQLVMPETIYGGHLYNLHKAYDQEIWKTKDIKKLTKLPPNEGARRICLLVRTASMHGRAADAKSRTERMTLDLLITSLLRQSNPNWEAFFFITDEKPFEAELQEIVSSHGDARLHFLDIPKSARPPYKERDAGYTATDAALRLVKDKEQCDWLSITNGDNIYGSNVFNRVLNVGPLHQTFKRPNVFLTPLDSRNYADQDYTRKRIAANRHDSYDQRCIFLEDELHRYTLGYAMTPFPNLGGLDLAGLFMERKKFVETGVYFSNFSDPAKGYQCPGCQDGYFITHVTTQAQPRWSVIRAPIEKFSSLIFHGPSPLWCIAQGNVWFDHPGKTVCLSHKTVAHLHPSRKIDWERYYGPKSERICLRVSAEVWDRRETAVIT
mmetsp:Transcript_21617/g.36213  ORF Transcript_21617/g.36213 Transcript_21617/m.36213 type:complete len:702 (+) Transcript_21617:56-2161(+)